MDTENEKTMNKFLIFLNIVLGLVLLFSVAFFLGNIYLASTINGGSWENTLTVNTTPVPSVTPLKRPTYSPASVVSPTPEVLSPSVENSVKCTNCEGSTNVVVSIKPAEVKEAGTVTVDYQYSPAPFTVNNGNETEPNELVLQILKRQELGHLSYNVEIPGVMYSIGGTEVSPNIYKLEPQDISLTRNYVVKDEFSILYPVLSEKQFKFIRSKQDYRFVYGLIKGVVEHEQKHYKTMKSYVSEVTSILNKPLSETQIIKATDKNAFRNVAANIISSEVSKRLQVARTNHEELQNNIDAPRPSITFRFENEVDGEVPPEITAQFLGEGKFVFQLPAGEIPRPPKPQIN